MSNPYTLIIMKTLRYIILSMAFCLLVNYSNGQSNMNLEGEIPTPSTDSWNTVNYGSVGASLYSGTVNVSVPFYTYKDKDFTIPISLDYASNGHMPNQKAGILGPDWNLNVGGAIIVEIKGIPDYRSDQFGNRGFYDLSKQNYNDFTNPGIWRFINPADVSVSNGMHPPYLILCPDGQLTTATQKYDAEPDIYHFNFMGYSGTFHRGFNDTTYIYNTNTNSEDFKILIDDNFTLITIFTANGYQYQFSTLGLNSDLIFEPIDSDLKRRVAWKLSKIVSPNGREAIFTYTDFTSSNMHPASFSVTGTLYNCPPPQLNLPIIPISEAGSQLEHGIVESVKASLELSSITIDGGPSIFFEYSELSENESDAFNSAVPDNIITFKNSYRLNSISVKTDDGSVLANCALSYANNNAGAKINYLSQIDILGEGAFHMDYHNWNNSSIGFPGNGTLSVDHWGYYNGKNNNNSSGIPFLKLGYLTTAFDEIITSDKRNSDYSFAKTGMLEKITYPTGGYTLLDYEANDYSIVFKRLSSNSFNHSPITENGICGGLRINSISNYDISNVLYDSKTYEYKNGINSSGILLNFPRYNVKYNAYTVVAFGGLVESNINYYSASINSYNGSHIEYSKVKEINGDSSIVEYNFSNSQTSVNYRDVVQLINVIPEPALWYDFWVIDKDYISSVVAPASSKKDERGKLLEKKIYSALNFSTPVFLETNSYDSDRQLSVNYIPVYLVRKFGYYASYVDNYKLTGQTTKENRNGTEVIKHIKYNYNAYGQAVRVATRDSKGDSIITKYQYVKDLSAAQITPSSIYRSMLDYNVISYPLSELVYIKKGGSGSEIQISGKRYTYINPVSTNKAIIKLSKVEFYDNSTSGWYTEVEYTSFDSKGNILESKSRNNIYTSYVWGYNGLYLVAKVDNMSVYTLKNSVSGLSGILDNPLTGAIVSGIHSTLREYYPNSLATLYDYKPFVGLSKVTDPSGKVTLYDYNSSGKLNSIKDSKNLPQNTIFYSPDNKL